jgi:hypothetical protein
MSMIRGLGKLAGKTAGFVVGKPIEMIGKASGIDLIEDIGKGVRQASEFAGDTVGQVADGAINTVSGIIKEDPTQRDKGLGDMGGAVSRTAKGVVETVKHTIHNGTDVVSGVIDGDNERVKKGATSLVKTVAIGALAVGVVDLVDGVDGVVSAEAPADTPIDHTDSTTIVDNESSRVEGNINEHLAGSEHPETGVPFVEKTVFLPDGESVTGVFPVFESEFDVTLDDSLYLQSDYIQFSYANIELYEAIEADPTIADELRLSMNDIQGLANGDTPEGYTWHHNEEPGLLQLVDKEEHSNTGHNGGRDIWGGGNEYR